MVRTPEHCGAPQNQSHQQWKSPPLSKWTLTQAISTILEKDKNLYALHGALLIVHSSALLGLLKPQKHSYDSVKYNH